MDKKTALEMSYDEWQDILDPDHREYLDHMKDIRGLDIHDKEACWEDFHQAMGKAERVFGNYYRRVSKDEAWDVYEEDWKNDTSRMDEEYKEIVYKEHTIQILQWHHIEPVKDPYWKRCVDAIEKAINNK